MHGGVRFIAITGGSGSGKTWLARELTRRLGCEASHLCLDDFYQDLGHLPEEDRNKVNFDDPDAIDWEELRAVAGSLKRGEAASVPDYDFAGHVRRPGDVRIESRSIIIMEGLWLLHPEWLRKQFSLSVFVDCPEALRLQRRIDRDQAHRGRSEQSVRKQFSEHVQPMHLRFVEPQREWATTCVSPPLGEDEMIRLLGACRG